MLPAYPALNPNTVLCVDAAAGLLNGEPGTYTVALAGGPANGVVVINPDGSFTYTPDAGFYSETDTFTFQISNGDGGTAIGSVTITVGSPVS